MLGWHWVDSGESIWSCHGLMPLLKSHILHKRRISMRIKVTSEFRQEVVRVALSSGLTRKQVASDFKIALSTLCRWIREERDNVIQSEPQLDLIQENQRLRKEVRLLREEREILKKATQFFASQKL